MEHGPTSNSDASSSAFSEEEGLVWGEAGVRWRDFFRANPEIGFEFIWHDVVGRSACELTVPGRSGTVELWLNFKGRAFITQRGGEMELPPNSSAVFAGSPRQVRLGEKRHKFVLVRFTTAFVLEHFAGCLEDLPSSLRSALRETSSASARPLPAPLSHQQRQLVRRLRSLPAERASRRLWYSSRAFELMLAFLTTREEPLLAQPQNGRKSRERVQRVLAILQSAIASPPALKELARQVGSSPFYLSRQFHAETGTTIPQFIQQFRMERAIELLRSGACNVSETAAAVGYASVSHFTTIFQQKFGCLPSHVATLPPGEAANILSLHS